MLPLEPITASAHARNSLSAALDEDVWHQAQGMLQSRVPSTAASQPVSACPKSAEDAIDSISAVCSSCLAGCDETGQEQAIQGLCAVHSCCTAFTQLSLSTQMLSTAAQLQPDQNTSWSQLIAQAQRQRQTGRSAQTCWPHIMRQPLPAHTLPAWPVNPDADLDTVQALLDQTCLLLTNTTSGSSFQHALHSRLLDVVLLQLWPYIPASGNATGKQRPAVADTAASAGKQELARRLAGMVPTLAKLLSHMVEMASYHITLALQQQLEELEHPEKVDELKAVMGMGLDHKQVLAS